MKGGMNENIYDAIYTWKQTEICEIDEKIIWHIPYMYKCENSEKRIEKECEIVYVDEILIIKIIREKKIMNDRMKYIIYNWVIKDKNRYKTDETPIIVKNMNICGKTMR